MLDERDADPDLLVAALRFIETRKVEGYQPRLREILTTRYAGKTAREIEAACIDAIVATMNDPYEAAQAIALAATQDLPVTVRCERALSELGPPALEAVITELTQAHPGPRLRKLARLLAKLSNVPPPQPIPFWGSAGEDERTAAAVIWEQQIRLAGKL